MESICTYAHSSEHLNMCSSAWVWVCWSSLTFSSKSLSDSTIAELSRFLSASCGGGVVGEGLRGVVGERLRGVVGEGLSGCGR